MTCIAIEKKFIPTDCPNCGVIVMSNDFFCDKCAQSQANHGPGCPACGGHKYGTGYAHHEPGGHRKNCYHRAALASTEPKG